MTTTRKGSTRTVLMAGAVAVAFAAGSIGTATASPLPSHPVAQSVATHELGEQHAPLTADQLAARQQLRTAISSLIEAIRAGDEASAQTALSQVIAATKAVKAADAAAAAAQATDEESSDSGDATEATDEKSSDGTEATDEESSEARDDDAAEHTTPVAQVARSDKADHQDGQAHSAAWHNGKGWAPAHDSRDRHDAARGDSRHRADGRRHDGGGHHGSHHGGHRSGR